MLADIRRRLSKGQQTHIRKWIGWAVALNGTLMKMDSGNMACAVLQPSRSERSVSNEGLPYDQCAQLAGRPHFP